MFDMLKKVFADFLSDEIFTRSSSLAYYSALAMAPIIVLFVWTLSVIGVDLQADLVGNVESFVGNEGARLVATIIQGAEKRPDLSSLSGWLGFAGLLFSASVIFAELQGTMNLIFDTETKKVKSKSLFQSAKGLLFDRLFSIGMLLTFVFLAITSLILSSFVAYFFRGFESSWLQTMITAVNFIVFSFLFALIFKYMPDRSINKKAAYVGGAITSALFSVGKTAVSYYLARASVGSAYGAAGSFAVLLVWLYYSSVIFYFGAEIAFALLVETPGETKSDSHSLRDGSR